jgi:hypothetical protein
MLTRIPLNNADPVTVFFCDPPALLSAGRKWKNQSVRKDKEEMVFSLLIV